jgi:hypothetical protein
VLAEAGDVLLGALDGAVLLVDAAQLGGGLEDAAHGDLGLAAALGERHRGAELHVGVAALVVDQALGRRHLEEVDPVGVVGAVGAVHHVAPRAAGAHVHRVRGGGRAAHRTRA